MSTKASTQSHRSTYLRYKGVKPKRRLLGALKSPTILRSMWDMASVTQITQAQGALMMWDLSHSVGAMPIELDQNNADLARSALF